MIRCSHLSNILSTSRLSFSAVALLGVFVSSSASLAQLPLTNLYTVYPPGGKQGSSFDATITGKELDEVDKLTFSHPGITATQKMSEGTDLMPAGPVPNQFTIKIDAKVPPGIYEARVSGRFGVSNPRAFEVGRFDESQDDGSNKTHDTAKELKVPATVNARVDANARDYWKFALKKGQRVMIDCSAERIDSRADGTLAVYDASGRELMRNRDAIGLDPLIDFTAPADGNYTVGVYDFVYRGGAEYYYRLSIHSAPYIDYIFPPAGKAGSNSQYTVWGRNLPGGKPDMNVTIAGNPLEKITTNINIPADAASRTRGSGSVVRLHSAMIDGTDFQLSSPAGASNPMLVGIALTDTSVETEPNNSADKAQKITVPCDFAGQFYPARDIDWVEFDAKQGEIYWVEVISHRAGLSTDPTFLLQRVTKNDKGEEQVSDVAAIDDPGDRNTRFGQDYDTSTDDPIYKFTVPADASYRVAVRDQFNTLADDPSRVYRLVIRKESPDFSLVAKPAPDGPVNNNIVPLMPYSVRKGGTMLINLTAEKRDGFNETIDISIEGLPNGVTSSGATIGAQSTTATLVVSAVDNTTAWSGPIRIIGKAKVDGKDVVREATNGCPVWYTTNRTNDPPKFRMMRDVVLSVIDKETAIASIGLEDKVWETSRGGKFEIPITVARRDPFKGDMKVSPFSNPKDLKPKDITVKGNAKDGKVSIELTSANMKAGFYTFCLKSDVKFKYPRNADAIKRAEEEQKRLDQVVKDVTAKQKEATAAKTKATQEATAAANSLKQAKAARDAASQALQKAAEAQKADAQKKLDEAEKVFKDAEAKSKAAADAKTAADKASTEADQKLKTAQAAKKTADTAVTTAKNANKVADKTVTVYSPPIKLRVVETPVELTASAPGGPVKQGEKLELPIKVGRKYGFDDQVQILFELPKGVSGISVKSINIAKGQTDGKLELVAAANATPGEHTVTIRARAKFNNVSNLDSTQQVAIKVEEVAKK